MKERTHLTSFDIVFWKVDFIESLSITVPSSETFLARCYSTRRILVTQRTNMEFHLLMDEKTPMNVELRAFIESHFKCTIMNVKLIFRLGFGVKLQNLPDPRCKQPMRVHQRKYTGKFEFSWMYRSAWLDRNIKGTISSKGSLSETILVRKYKIFKSASSMGRGQLNLWWNLARNMPVVDMLHESCVFEMNKHG